MSQGNTPFDKKSYRESKLRRKQAMLADKTGRIRPIANRKRRVLAVSIIVLSVIILCIVFFAVFSVFNKNSENTEAYNTENEDLLVVVNRSAPLDSDYIPPLSELNGFKVHTSSEKDLKLLLDEAKKGGFEIDISSAYVSYSEQEALYKSTLAEFLKNPQYTEVRAEAEAERVTPKAGCSEAQTGLLVDFNFKSESERAFLERNCVNYGFILRYPQNKQSQTQMNPSKTLYRYVGKDNAVKMRSLDMCLEEFRSYTSLQNN